MNAHCYHKVLIKVMATCREAKWKMNTSIRYMYDSYTRYGHAKKHGVQCVELNGEGTMGEES